MELWTSGELQVGIDDDFREVRKQIECVINDNICNNNYGSGIVEWAVIFMIYGELGPKNWKEVKKYHKKRKVFEARIKVDFLEFKNADQNGKFHLLYLALMETLNWLENMKIADIDVPRLRADTIKAIEADSPDF
jgi:hypothetical protein